MYQASDSRKTGALYSVWRIPNEKLGALLHEACTCMDGGENDLEFWGSNLVAFCSLQQKCYDIHLRVNCRFAFVRGQKENSNTNENINNIRQWFSPYN